MFEMFLKLLIGHAIADYWAQSDFIAKMKNRHIDTTGEFWPYVLTAHALMHGAAVWLVTGSVWLCLAETVAHWAIDYGKCEKWYGMHADQGMHIGCKFAWVAIA